MARPSSADLHPPSGARFVLVRMSEAPPTYEVAVHLADGRTLASLLAWDEHGHARLTPTLADAWAHDETLKLARSLKQRPKARMIRWRGASDPG